MSFLSKLASKTKSKRSSVGDHSRSSSGGYDQTTPLFLLPSLATTSLLKGRLQPLVKLPECVDKDEWLASSIFEFFEYINLFYGAISNFCTPKDCPTMSAGSHDYTWSDAHRRHVKLPAPQYIDYVMTWIQNCLDDESVFPTKAGNAFPKDFENTIRTICRQLVRVFAHIFYTHYDKLVHLNAERHFNSLFAHFYAFCREFDLLDKKDTAPLQELIALLESNNVF
ncbi:Maintenance of ploidy protein mob2 [Dimargaris xerosporica]|nr:Maintenance of ploidy protein mob2 [Dimargaris xerosporica]